MRRFALARGMSVSVFSGVHRSSTSARSFIWPVEFMRKAFDAFTTSLPTEKFMNASTVNGP